MLPLPSDRLIGIFSSSCTRLSLSFHKTGGSWANPPRKNFALTPRLCTRLSRSFHKTGGASANPPRKNFVFPRALLSAFTIFVPKFHLRKITSIKNTPWRSAPTKKLLSISVKFILLPAIALLLLYFAFAGARLARAFGRRSRGRLFLRRTIVPDRIRRLRSHRPAVAHPPEALGYRHVSKINSINAVTITYITNLVIPRAGEIARCTASTRPKGSR